MKKIIFTSILIVFIASATTLAYINYIESKAVPTLAVNQQTTQNEVAQSTPTYTPIPTPTPDNTLKIVVVGDILLGRGVETRLKKEKKTYIYPFEKVAELLKKGDVIFGNLEEPITASTHSLLGIKEGGKYVLKNEVEAFEGIKYAGFNIMNLANNHILDYYDKGMYDTIDMLDKQCIVHSGAGKNMDEARKPAKLEKKGLKIGMLSYTDMSQVVYKGNPQISFIAGESKPGVAPRNFDYIKEDIAKLRSSVDILIISLHWGIEESFEVPKSQREFAYKLLELGADMIIGHHPHQFQGIEIYKGKPIMYSLGNFIFDQNDPENQEAFIVNMKYTGNKLTDFEAIPVRTIDKMQVVPQSGQGATKLLEREAELSGKLGVNCTLKDDKIIFDLK